MQFEVLLYELKDLQQDLIVNPLLVIILLLSHYAQKLANQEGPSLQVLQTEAVFPNVVVRFQSCGQVFSEGFFEKFLSFRIQAGVTFGGIVKQVKHLVEIFPVSLQQL